MPTADRPAVDTLEAVPSLMRVRIAGGQPLTAVQVKSESVPTPVRQHFSRAVCSARS